MPNTDIGAVAHAVAEVAKLWNTWLISGERRRMRKCIDAAENYVMWTEYPDDDASPDRIRKKQVYYRSKFFKLNN